MAETKSKKSTPKLFDIAKPGKSTPSSTSRPVIITNRPVLKDPMVIKVSSDDEEPTPIETTTESAEMKHKVDIKPLHIDLSEVLGAPVVKDDKKAEETAPKDDVPEESTAPEVNDAVAVEVKKDADKPTAEPEKVSEPTPDAEPEKPTEPTEADKPAVVPRRTTGERVIAPLGPVSPEPEKPTETPPETPASEPEETPTLPSEEDEPSLDNSDTPVLSEKEAKAADEAKKKAEEQEKIIASGAYYLPINRVEKRRAKRNVLLGSLLLIVLLALAGYAAWDAGIVTIPGVEAPTNFL
jgi:hypothetical protein